MHFNTLRIQPLWRVTMYIEHKTLSPKQTQLVKGGVTQGGCAGPVLDPQNLLSGQPGMDKPSTSIPSPYVTLSAFENGGDFIAF